MHGKIAMGFLGVDGFFFMAEGLSYGFSLCGIYLHRHVYQSHQRKMPLAVINELAIGLCIRIYVCVYVRKHVLFHMLMFVFGGDEMGRKEAVEKRVVRVPAPREGNLEIPPEDGFTWRKYGQKEILHSRYPR